VPNVLIRDLPPEVHAVLVRRAEAAGQSLQQYLVATLDRLSQVPTPQELFERLEAQSTRRKSGNTGRVGLKQAVADLNDERGDRDRR